MFLITWNNVVGIPGRWKIFGDQNYWPSDCGLKVVFLLKFGLELYLKSRRACKKACMETLFIRWHEQTPATSREAKIFESWRVSIKIYQDFKFRSFFGLGQKVFFFDFWISVSQATVSQSSVNWVRNWKVVTIPWILLNYFRLNNLILDFMADFDDQDVMITSAYFALVINCWIVNIANWFGSTSRIFQDTIFATKRFSEGLI